MSGEAIARTVAAEPAEARSGSVPFWRRLSTKLLVLTVGFVLISELLIFPTSLATFRMQWLQQRLRAVGRMALTNYLMQSVICGLVFYGYGLGLFGRLGAAAGLLVVAAVWLLELLWSPVWLRYFQMGPVEWAWRSLADGHARSFLRRA